MLRAKDLIPWSRERRAAPAQRKGGDRNRALQTDINRAFEDFWRSFQMPAAFAAPFGRAGLDLIDSGTPPVDMRDTDQDVEVKIDLPGMGDADVDVSVVDGALTVSGIKKAEHEESGDGYVVRERSFGRVERIVPLPDGLDLDAAKARFSNGVLTVTIPKTAEGRSAIKRVRVQRE